LDDIGADRRIAATPNLRKRVLRRNPRCDMYDHQSGRLVWRNKATAACAGQQILLNLLLGVKRAGYSVGEELPIFLLIFTIPAGAAAFLWWRSFR
jgi:hypothetical protein